MELWIRTQDKEELLKVNKIDYEEKFDYKTTKKRYFVISANNEGVGLYSTERQCLEILDEIQKMLVPVLDSDGHMVDYTSNIVYEMPEDKEKLPWE